MNKFKKMMLQSNAQQQQNMLNHYQKMPTIFDIFNRPLDDFNFFKDSGFHDNFKVDIEDFSDHYELKADMPGVKKEDIKLDFDELPIVSDTFLSALYLKSFSSFAGAASEIGAADPSANAMLSFLTPDT